jgi:hypothetical protein
MLVGALVVQLFQKYILRIKGPSIEDLWLELEEQDWYQSLVKDDRIKEFMLVDKDGGLLSDPHYVRKIIDKEGHREGFIRYVHEKVK